MHVFVGPDFVVTIRHGETSELAEVRRWAESRPGSAAQRSPCDPLRVMDRVVDDYAPVVEGLESDIDEIEVEVFEGKPGVSAEVSRRIYALFREVVQFHQATQPLAGCSGAWYRGRRAGD